ncbi:hypothetical protein AX17_002983 [Amanita inopinata Kibby_2008]|nr:hypothetical protein AX17_002983 [Amanita inopinata Kibby_2008]
MTEHRIQRSFKRPYLTQILACDVVMDGELLRDNAYASLVALTLQISELLACFHDEVECLWPVKFTATKLLYLWSRYFSLAAQIVNAILTYLLHSRYFELRHCNKMLVFQLFLLHQGITCIELIAFLRVYVLYNKSARIRTLLLLVFTTGSTLESIGVFTRSRSLVLETSCSPLKTGTTGGMFLLMGLGMNQSVVIFLIIAKLVMTRSVGWGRTPLASLMMRDELGIVLLFAVLGSVGLVGSIPSQSKLRNVKFPMFIALLSTSGCRLILGMCRLVRASRQNRVEDTSIPVLTSEIEIITDGM